MEVYKAETQEILKRYADQRISRHQCVQALNAAAVGTIHNLKPDQLKEFQDAVRANEEALREHARIRRVQ